MTWEWKAFALQEVLMLPGLSRFHHTLRNAFYLFAFEAFKPNAKRRVQS
jgi:hypothetical protein